MYPKGTAYMSSWNGRISLPQGWAIRNGDRDSNALVVAGSSQSHNKNSSKSCGKLAREVIATVDSSQRASNAVDRLIDAINEGKIPLSKQNFQDDLLPMTQSSSSFKYRTIQPSHVSNKLPGQKSRVRKIIDEFLDIARKRGLYSRSPTVSRNMINSTHHRPRISEEYQGKQPSFTQPPPYCGINNEPVDHYGSQPSTILSQVDQSNYLDDDCFQRTDSPDLFEIDERTVQKMSEPENTFFDQPKEKWWCVPYHCNPKQRRFAANFDEDRMNEEPRRLDSGWWISSQPNMWPQTPPDFLPHSNLCRTKNMDFVSRESKSVRTEDLKLSSTSFVGKKFLKII